MPFFEGVAGNGLTGSAALVGQDGDLVDWVGVSGPARWDEVGRVPDVFGVDPVDDGLKPFPQLGAHGWVLDGPGLPRSGQLSKMPNSLSLLVVTVEG